MKDNLGNRMKRNYEDRQRFFLTRRVPVIMRLDGRAFHTLTRHGDTPFDQDFIDAMVRTMMVLFRAVQGAKVAYHQSDEMTLLITDFDTLETEAWFDYEVSKMTSIAAGIASAFFNLSFKKFAHFSDVPFSVFDCRVHNIPKEDAVNNFVWRAKDWKRNSLSMYARSFFSHKELHRKSQSAMHEMLYKIGKNWATDLTPQIKNGTFLIKTDSGIEKRYDILPTFEHIDLIVSPFLYNHLSS
jgi:tRNA(His) guanylyltransferase